METLVKLFSTLKQVKLKVFLFVGKETTKLIQTLVVREFTNVKTTLVEVRT